MQYVKNGWSWSETDETLGLSVLQRIYVGYFWCPIPWVWFGVIRCTLQNFQFRDFRNNTPSTVFIRFEPNFIQSIIIWGWYRLLLFFGNLTKINNSMSLWNFSQHRTTWGLKFRNDSPPTISIWCQPNFMRTLATKVVYRLSLFLAIGQILKMLRQFEISTCESKGKPNMLNISKTANRRAKQTKMWDSVYYSAHM